MNAINFLRTFIQSKKPRVFIYGSILLGLALPLSLNAQLVTYTFTPCGAIGRIGPTQLQVNGTYLTTNLNGSVTSVAGIQQFTIPIAGAYRVETRGAQGANAGAAAGGLGARMIGDFTFTVGTVLKIVVGQRGIGDLTGAGGGGGGSYVATLANVPLCVAGGGSGSGDTSYPGTSAGTGSVGNPGGTCPTNAGPTGFGGGDATLCGNGDGGAGGFYGDGASASAWGVQRGYGFVNGSNGGLSSYLARDGGFGGAAGTHANNTGGGAGGGYTGGGASYHGAQYVGGAGSSYNAGTNQTNTGSYNAGAGLVLITRLCDISINAIGTNTNGAICAGSSVTLTTDAVSSYSWSTSETTSSIIVTPAVTTTYSLTAMSPSACITTAMITVTVDTAVPTLTVTNTATVASGVCPNSTVNLSAAGATTYSWTGGISNGVTFTPIVSNTYVVTGYNACGTTTAAVSLSVHPLPPVTAAVSQPSVCSGNTIVLIGGGAVTYAWSGGPGIITNGQPYFPAATANYTVIGTSVLGCTAAASVGNTVVTTPLLAPVAVPTLVCMGGSGTISVSGATNYTWIPVAQNNFAGSNAGTITITPTITATYTVIKANSNCTDTKTITVYVNALPTVFALAAPSLACQGSTVALSGGGANTYTWIPSSFNLVGTNVVVTATANTVYTVTGSDGTCTATYTVLVNTKTTPTITAVTTATSICAGGTVTMTASGAGTGGIYSWTPGPFTGATYVVSPANPVSYQVTGTNSLNCSAQTSQIIIVYPNPPVNAVPNKPLVCVGGPCTITASGAHTYVWSTGALTATTLVNPVVSTVYTVTGTYTTTGCSTTQTALVQAYIPVTAITGPTAVCIGSSITLVSAPANTYTWTQAGIPLGNTNSIFVGPLVNTTYSLGTTSTSANVNCVGSNVVTIIVNPLPNVTSSCTRTLICRVFESTEIFGGGAVTYNWYSNVGNIGSGNSVVVSPTAGQTTYTVEGTDVNGCVNTNTIIIKTSACVGLNENTTNNQNISIYPNPGPGEFSIKTDHGMELNLVNELGQVIREIHLNAENNYKATVKDLANGIYFVSSKEGSNKVNQKVIIQK